MFRDMAAELLLPDTLALAAERPTDAAATAPAMWTVLWTALCAAACAASWLTLLRDVELRLKSRSSKLLLRFSLLWSVILLDLFSPALAGIKWAGVGRWKSKSLARSSELFLIHAGVPLVHIDKYEPIRSLRPPQFGELTSAMRLSKAFRQADDCHAHLLLLPESLSLNPKV